MKALRAEARLNLQKIKATLAALRACSASAGNDMNRRKAASETGQSG